MGRLAIIRRMRTLALILMIALLPLRLWAADGMSVRMAHGEVVAAQQVAAHAMPDDCPMMGNAPSDAASHDGSSPAPNCLTCHLVASVSTPEPALPQAAAPSGPPRYGPSRYLSAQSAPDLRPPIA